MVLCIHLPPLLSLQPVTMAFPRCLLVSLYCPWGWSCLCSWGCSFQHLLSSLLIAAVFPTLQQKAPSYCSVPYYSFTFGPWAVVIVWSQMNKGKKPKPVNFFSLTPNTELEEKPKNTPSSPSNPKKLARKAVLQEDQDCLNQVRRAGRQLIWVFFTPHASTNLYFSPGENLSN